MTLQDKQNIASKVTIIGASAFFVGGMAYFIVKTPETKNFTHTMVVAGILIAISGLISEGYYNKQNSSFSGGLTTARQKPFKKGDSACPTGWYTTTDSKGIAWCEPQPSLNS